MKKIYEYMMHKTKHGIQTPEWVEDGDWFYHPTKKTYLMVVDENVEYYLPDTLNQIFTKEELFSRVLEIHQINPIRNVLIPPKTEIKNIDHLKEYVDIWWDIKINGNTKKHNHI